MLIVSVQILKQDNDRYSRYGSDIAAVSKIRHWNQDLYYSALISNALLTSLKKYKKKPSSSLKFPQISGGKKITPESDSQQLSH